MCVCTGIEIVGGGEGIKKVRKIFVFYKVEKKMDISQDERKHKSNNK